MAAWSATASSYLGQEYGSVCYAAPITAIDCRTSWQAGTACSAAGDGTSDANDAAGAQVGTRSATFATTPVDADRALGTASFAPVTARRRRVRADTMVGHSASYRPGLIVVEVDVNGVDACP